LPKPDNLK